MENYYDLFVKYNDEEKEKVVMRAVTSDIMYAMLNYLLRERKNHFIYKIPKTHYPEYIRIE